MCLISLCSFCDCALCRQKMKPSSKDPLRRLQWEYVVKHNITSKPEDIGVVLEGQMVLHDLDNVALAAAMLFGLMYALNLNYPPELKYSFEVLQKVVMELDGNTLSHSVRLQKVYFPPPILGFGGDFCFLHVVYSEILLWWESKPLLLCNFRAVIKQRDANTVSQKTQVLKNRLSELLLCYGKVDTTQWPIVALSLHLFWTLDKHLHWLYVPVCFLQCLSIAYVLCFKNIVSCVPKCTSCIKVPCHICTIITFFIVDL